MRKTPFEFDGPKSSLRLILKEKFGKFENSEIVLSASTPFTIKKLEDSEVRHMLGPLDQLETSLQPIAHISGYRRNLSEILFLAFTIHISNRHPRLGSI